MRITCGSARATRHRRARLIQGASQAYSPSNNTGCVTSKSRAVGDSTGFPCETQPRPTASTSGTPRRVKANTIPVKRMGFDDTCILCHKTTTTPPTVGSTTCDDTNQAADNDNASLAQCVRGVAEWRCIARATHHEAYACEGGSMRSARSVHISLYLELKRSEHEASQ